MEHTEIEHAELQKKWPALKEKLKSEYPFLTNEDLAYEIGQEGELLKRLQGKLGKNKKEIFDWLKIMG